MRVAGAPHPPPQKPIMFGLTDVYVNDRGPGSGGESASTALQAAGLTIKSIEDVTPLPHNGCRPKKRRRVCPARRQALPRRRRLRWLGPRRASPASREYLQQLPESSLELNDAWLVRQDRFAEGAAARG